MRSPQDCLLFSMKPMTFFVSASIVIGGGVMPSPPLAVAVLLPPAKECLSKVKAACASELSRIGNGATAFSSQAILLSLACAAV